MRKRGADNRIVLILFVIFIIVFILAIVSFFVNGPRLAPRFQAANTKVAPIDDSGGDPGAPSPYRPDAEMCAFLQSLWNGLVARGLVQGSAVSTCDQVMRLDPDKLIQGINAYDSSRGGVLIGNSLYGPYAETDMPFSVTASGNDKIRIVFTPTGTEVIQNRIGILPWACDALPTHPTGGNPGSGPSYGLTENPVEPIVSQNEDKVFQELSSSSILDSVSNNVKCLAIYKMNLELVNNPQGTFEQHAAVVQSYLNGVLAQYRQAGVISSFSVDALNDRFTVFIGGVSREGLLFLGDVNPYANANAEAQSVYSEMNYKLKFGFMHYYQSSTFLFEDRSIIYSDLIKSSVLKANAESSPMLKNFYDIKYYITNSQNQENNLDFCEYAGSEGLGVITPCNKNYLLITGGPEIGFSECNTNVGVTNFIKALNKAGYLPSSITLGESSNLISELMRNQIIVFQGHGLPGGDVIISDKLNSYELQCCQEMFDAAYNMGLISREEYLLGKNRCLTADPPTDAGGGKVKRYFSGTDHCTIVLDKEVFVSSSYQPKKAIFTTGQCFGGSLSANFNAFDKFSGPRDEETWPDQNKYNFNLYGNDLSGDTQILMESQEQEFFNSNNRLDKNTISPVFSMRNLDTSYQLRGSERYDSGTPNHPCQSSTNQNTKLKTFCDFLNQGDPNTLVELAPSVQQVKYLNNVLSIWFTSKTIVDFNSIEVDDSMCRPPKLQNAAKHGTIGWDPITGSLDIPLDTGKYMLVSEEAWTQFVPWNKQREWDTDPYGGYLEIKIKKGGAKAPNGIPLAGNKLADKPWVWHIDEGPYWDLYAEYT